MAESSYRQDIVAIGASSGGIEALTAIVVANAPPSACVSGYRPARALAEHG
jgi:chemotaxis response regulator CheB